MNEISGANYKNISATGIVKTGTGKVWGAVVNSHSSGVIKLYNGLLDSGSGVKATVVLTIADPFTISDGEWIKIGAVKYVFKTALTTVPYTSPNEVLIGASDAVTLDNLKLAVIGAGTEGEIGVKYSTGTIANPVVTATTNTDTAQTFEALAVGQSYNAEPATVYMANGTLNNPTLTGGANAPALMLNTYTIPAGSQVIKFPEPFEFTTGLYMTLVSGTLDITWAIK